MDITDTLNPALIFSTITASCALKKNLTFSTARWIYNLIALLLCIHHVVLIIDVEFARLIRILYSDHAEVSENHVSAYGQMRSKRE